MSRYRWTVVDGIKMTEHRAVWETAHGPIPPGYVIHHIDGNGKNNDLSNLQLMTVGEHNSLHARLKREGVDVVDANDPDVVEFRKKMRASSARFYTAHREKENARSRKYRNDHHDEALERERRYYKLHHDVRERYRQENHDVLLEKGKAYREEHREEIRERGRKHYHEHKEEESARAKAYRISHLEYFKRVNSEYHQSHREEIRTRKKLAYWRKKGTNPDLVSNLEEKLNDLKKARLTSKK